MWLVIEAVGRMDTSAFHARRRTGGAGAAGYDPDMLVTVLVWAYAHGVTSSRRMEELCRTDVAFRVICAGNLPDHVTIARFRKDFGGGGRRGSSRRCWCLCARLGMGRLGTVALDGMKIAASASKSANRTRGEAAGAGGARRWRRTRRRMRPRMSCSARAGGGMSCRQEAWSPRRRGERIAAALAQLEAERRRRRRRRAGEGGGVPGAAAGRAADRARAGGGGGGAGGGEPGPGDRRPGGRSWPGWRSGMRPGSPAAAARPGRVPSMTTAGSGRPRPRWSGPGRGPRRRRPRAAAKAAGPGPVRNITDPDSRLMPTAERVHPGIQRAERDQRRRPGHRHRADR